MKALLESLAKTQSLPTNLDMAELETEFNLFIEHLKNDDVMMKYNKRFYLTEYPKEIADTNALINSLKMGFIEGEYDSYHEKWQLKMSFRPTDQDLRVGMKVCILGEEEGEEIDTYITGNYEDRGEVRTSFAGMVETRRIVNVYDDSRFLWLRDKVQEIKSLFGIEAKNTAFDSYIFKSILWRYYAEQIGYDVIYPKSRFAITKEGNTTLKKKYRNILDGLNLSQQDLIDICKDWFDYLYFEAIPKRVCSEE